MANGILHGYFSMHREIRPVALLIAKQHGLMKSPQA
jgi:hypothetical protein